MSKIDPEWLPPIREFCRNEGITIMAWGPQALVVEAKSPECAAEVSLKLRQLGFQAIEDAEDAYAGILTLSRNP